MQSAGCLHFKQSVVNFLDFNCYCYYYFALSQDQLIFPGLGERICYLHNKGKILLLPGVHLEFLSANNVRARRVHLEVCSRKFMAVGEGDVLRIAEAVLNVL